MPKKTNIRANIEYDDLRGWIERATQLGEIREISGASWEKDMGLVAEVILREENGPCVLFDDVPGCPKGFRLLLNMFAGRRKNMTLGLPEHLNKWELSNTYRECFLKKERAIKHQIIDDGPIFENCIYGDQIDITQFPAPIWHEKDGGRYIGTGTYSITKDPDEGWLNAGAYRAMIQDKNIVGLVMARGHHGWLHREKYFKGDHPMPIVMVLGGDPLNFFYGGVEAPYGVFEIDLVGGMRGRPTTMVKGKITGLPFPSHAEIVLEGYVDPKKTMPEGPFGEWTGHYAGGVRDMPFIEIKAVYHRKNPILVGVPPMGGGPDEMARYRAVMRSALIKENMTRAGVPNVEQVWCHEIGGARMLHAISIKQSYPGHAVQAATIAAQCGASAYASKYIVVCDEDVDVTSLEQMLWCWITRTDPATAIQFLEGAWDSNADPSIPPAKRQIGDTTHSVALINACRPWSWKDKFPVANTPSPELTKEAFHKYSWLLDSSS